MTTAPARAKDLTVSNLIESWNGEGPVSATEFSNKIERAAKSGNWSDTDKVTVAVLKLTGAAALYLNSNDETTRDDITFQRLREIFIERFKVKHLDQFHYSALQNATQHRHETPEQFADRCRRLCALTIRQVADPAQQRIINEEADRRMLAAYTNGLFGNVGRQVRYRMPSTMTEAIQIATTVQEVELMEARKFQPRPSNDRVFSICFKCNKTGHVARDCRSKYDPSKPKVNTVNRPTKFSNSNNNYYNNSNLNVKRNLTNVQCYACQKYGHYARYCKHKSNANKNYPKGQGSTVNGTGLPNQK